MIGADVDRRIWCLGQICVQSCGAAELSQVCRGKSSGFALISHAVLGMISTRKIDKHLKKHAGKQVVAQASREEETKFALAPSVFVGQNARRATRGYGLVFSGEF